MFPDSSLGSKTPLPISLNWHLPTAFKTLLLCTSGLALRMAKDGCVPRGGPKGPVKCDCTFHVEPSAKLPLPAGLENGGREREQRELRGSHVHKLSE